MVTFLFWNLNKKPLTASVARLVRRHDVDVVMLVECVISAEEILATLNRSRRTGRFSAPDSESLCEHVVIYPRFPGQYLRILREDPRLTIRRLALPARSEILLAVVHLPSKLHYSPESQGFACSELSAEIRRAERAVNHTRTVLVGDFNMNPFESGIVAAGGLHAMLAEGIARRRSRAVQGRDYPFFYNAMWSRLGDKSAGPPGTYYYDAGEHLNYYWNTFDQLLIRPELLDGFAHEKMEVLTTDGEQSLLTKAGIPDRKVASDHLPLLFCLDF